MGNIKHYHRDVDVTEYLSYIGTYVGLRRDGIKPGSDLGALSKYINRSLLPFFEVRELYEICRILTVYRDMADSCSYGYPKGISNRPDWLEDFDDGLRSFIREFSSSGDFDTSVLTFLYRMDNPVTDRIFSVIEVFQ